MNLHNQKTNKPKEEITLFKKLFHDYLKSLGVLEVKELTYSQMRMVFVTSIADYKKERLNLEELSNIANSLWLNLGSLDKVATDLGNVLFDCAEASCPFCTDRHKQNMENVMKYYERFKVLALPK